MKILISAFACHPERGGESAVGAGIARIAASRHDVWVLTRPDDAAALRASPLGGRLRVEAVDIGGLAKRVEHRGRVLGWLHYHRWQEAAGARAAELDAAIGFDVLHHATYATYWAAVGLTAVARPLVIGPVGGAYLTPWRLTGELGWRGLAEDAARLLRRIAGLRPAVRRGLRSAAVALANNPATAARLPADSRTRLLTNALIVDVGAALEAQLPASRRDEVAVVGRLIPLKGGTLAVRAIRELGGSTVLCFYGDGPERPRLERLARRLAVADRVRFAGHVDRTELFRRVATAAAVLHPSLHDEAPLAVAEALSVGTPVVTLAHSGPAYVAGHWPDPQWRVIQPSWPAATGQRLAGALAQFVSSPRPPAPAAVAPRTSFAAELLAAYDQAAALG